MTLTIDELVITAQQRTTKLFNHYLKETASPADQLKDAMYYAVSNGGKRVRPLLVYATGYYLEAEWDSLDIAACAVEMIHSYSLIHDDLPAMDNADLRRGKPACHKAYNEAIAILAGDALQPLAFEIIASHPAQLSPAQRIGMINHLCHASGLNGMAAGQALDINGVHTPEQTIHMYNLKTGALLSTSVKLAIISSHQQDPQIQSSLEKFADTIGLAFQIQDDLLDIESNAEDIGKPKGLDLANNKVTYPLLVGVEQARATIDTLFKTALQSIETFDEKANILRELANFLLQRKK
jgi:geranylgeranyl pyrophosphate synthase